MASGSSLPPQAYTREILTAAFNWLQTQPDSVRRQATNPDSLVGIYMRAQRLADGIDSDAPISSQNFMSDLKNLAEGLKQFETPPNPRDLRRVQSTAPSANNAGAHHATQHTTHPAAHHASHQSPPSAPFSIPNGGLNERTLAMIQEVRNQLNLSSDSEAINMMISLAYKSLKNLLV